jgi:CheY-like chemotaxis protein
VRKKILIVDDDPNALRLIGYALQKEGYEIVIAQDGQKALEKIETERPDLVVLDVMMPEMDGYEVCRRIRATSPTAHLPIIIFTAKSQVGDKITGFEIGADDYLTKPVTPPELFARIKAVLRRADRKQSLPYARSNRELVLHIGCEPGQRIRIGIYGEGSFRSTTKDMLDLNEDQFARHSENIREAIDWRFCAREIGSNLFHRLFKEHPRLLSCYFRARGQTERGKLHISFESDSTLLRVPLECLFDDTTQSGDYLALQHPLTRYIQGPYSTHLPLSGIFLNELWESEKPLRVLLVGADTRPPVPGAIKEVDIVSKILQEGCNKRRIQIQITRLDGGLATGSNVVGALRKQTYHLVHFAGHSRFEPASPEQSFLVLWEDESQKSTQHLRVPELTFLLADSDVRFFYLSCCDGGASGGSEALLDDDFLGVLDGLIQAGVSAVLGFRWPVSDRGAQLFAEQFYRALIEQGQLSIAALRARQVVSARDRDDHTWLSPVLVVQE